MKDFKSILLALLSIGLIGTWFFHFYEKSHYKTDMQKTYIRDSAAIARIIREALNDSVQQLNSQQIDTIKINNDPVVDSLKTRLSNSVDEVISLKKEIDDILKNDQATQADLAKSKSLIADLNSKLDQLKSENKQLQVQKTKPSTNQNNIIPVKQSITNPVPKKLTKKDSLFIISDINLSAEAGTSSASDADKLTFSFTFRNNALEDSYYDLYVVITGPGNKVLQADQWAAAENFFTSRTEGTKAFTKRIRFEYNRGDQKRIVSSIEPERIMKGQYTMKIYLNGVVIGQTKKPIG